VGGPWFCGQNATPYKTAMTVRTANNIKSIVKIKLWEFLEKKYKKLYSQLVSDYNFY